MSQFVVWEIDFPGGIDIDNIKWRAVIWAISEVLLVLSVAINYLPPRLYSVIFRLSIFLMMVDFFLCLIWLPIGVSNTYGFRSARDVFTKTCKSHFTNPFCSLYNFGLDNGTGAPPAWNWILSMYIFNPGIINQAGTPIFYSLFTSGTMTGFDASGHVAEETKNARYVLFLRFSNSF